MGRKLRMTIPPTLLTPVWPYLPHEVQERKCSLKPSKRRTLTRLIEFGTSRDALGVRGCSQSLQKHKWKAEFYSQLELQDRTLYRHNLEIYGGTKVN